MLCQAKTIAISSLVTSLRMPRERVGSGDETKQLAPFPGSRAGEEERELGTHCSRMHQVPLVTCILLRYTKVNGNFVVKSHTAEWPICNYTLFKL